MHYEDFTAVFELQENGGYVAFIAEIDGVNTQGETLEEAKENLIDAFKLVMDYKRDCIDQSVKTTVIPFIPLLRNSGEKVKAS